MIIYILTIENQNFLKIKNLIVLLEIANSFDYTGGFTSRLNAPGNKKIHHRNQDRKKMKKQKIATDWTRCSPLVKTANVNEIVCHNHRCG